MSRTVYRFTFEKGVPIEDVEEAIVVARVATEGVHGQAQTNLDACYALCQRRRVCVIEVADAVGATIARVFTAVLLRTIGEDAFEVERKHIEDDVTPLPRRGEARR